MYVQVSSSPCGSQSSAAAGGTKKIRAHTTTPKTRPHLTQSSLALFSRSCNRPDGPTRERVGPSGVERVPVRRAAAGGDREALDRVERPNGRDAVDGDDEGRSVDRDRNRVVGAVRSR